MIFILDLCGFVFSACTNFSNSGDIKEIFDKEVVFNNSKSIELRVFSSNAETVPNGDTSSKIGESVSLICNPYSNYEFIKWQIKDKTSKKIYSEEEISQFIEIEDVTNAETSFKFIAEKNGLLVEPFCVERPRVLSYSPYFDQLGVFRDSRIIVSFDKKMEEGSIYFNGEELIDLGIEDFDSLIYDQKFLGDENNFFDLSEKVSQIADINFEHKVYGYKTSDGNIVYKNISIQNYKTKENLLEHFKAPYFEDSNTLIIPAQKEDKDKKISPPAGNNQVYVSISDGFYYINNDKNISLSKSEEWNYKVNTETDELAPIVSYKIFDSVSNKELTKDNFAFCVDSPSVVNYENLKQMPTISKEHGLKIYANVKDEGSRPNGSFMVLCTRFYDYNKKMNIYGDVENFSVPYEINAGTESQFGKSISVPTEINFFSYLNLKDGLYKIRFRFIDNNDNEFYTPYYYAAVDNAAPTFDSIYTTPDVYTTTNSATVNWANLIPKNIDYDHAVVRYKKSEEDSYRTIDKIFAKTDSETDISDLDVGVKYDFVVDFYDIAGNKLSSTQSRYTRPNKASDIVAENWSDYKKNVQIKWTWPSEGVYTGAWICFGTTPYISAATVSLENYVPKNQPPSLDVSLKSGTKYYIWVVTECTSLEKLEPSELLNKIRRRGQETNGNEDSDCISFTPN